MKKIQILLALMLVMLAPSCTKYLEVMPDNVLRVEDIYSTKEEAWRALTKMYTYLPYDFYTHGTCWELGDEFIGRIDAEYANGTGLLQGERIMRGLQSTGSPMLNFWTSANSAGANGGTKLYEGIRNTNLFLRLIQTTRDLADSERKDWIAQVKFLKAYYHFLLVRSYGPIVIEDQETPADALGTQLFPYRNKVDECFDFIIKLLDEAIPALPPFRQDAELGMIDQVIAASIKARVLLYRASPFYSGNREFYEDFLDPTDNQPFFPMDDAAATQKKWEEALAATREAIALAEQNGKALYTFDPLKPMFLKDRELAEFNPEQLQKIYDLRRVVVDPWNKELIWGMTNFSLYNDGDLCHSTNIRLSRASGLSEGDFNSSGYSWQWNGATLRMTERYYTKNGLPINEDPAWDYNGRYDLFTTPSAEDTVEYSKIAGLLQPGFTTVKLYADREIRFYANLDISGGWVRSHFEVIPVSMMAGGSGGYEPSVNSTDFFCTGVGLQKLVHPESRSSSWQRQVKFPYPQIRLADLYLMLAECLNETKSAPDQEVWDAINLVRRRAGIPDVEVSWAKASQTPNKHTTKAGMRDIILQERSIELAFEGIRFWDMQRTKRAHLEFASPIRGWNYKGSSPATFFTLGVVEARRFTTRDYLWPISLTELNTNGNLVQNPGW